MIIKSSQRVFICKTQDGQQIEATALGNLLKGEHGLVVGDKVQVDLTQQTPVIVHVEPRSNELFRFLPREKKRKITAANVDIMAILVSVAKPEYKRGMVDRYLLRAVQWDVAPIVIFNKMDMYDEEKIDLLFEVERLKSLGVRCFEYSATQKDYVARVLPDGPEQLIETLKNKMTIFLGQSGVGKSKTIAALSDGKIDLKTREIGKAGKGTHTTTWSEVVDCGRFMLIDSPGIRSFSVVDFLDRNIESYFPDLYSYISGCQFSNCQHNANAKGCGFAGLDEDNRQHQMILSRLDSYLRLKEEISETPDWEKNKKN